MATDRQIEALAMVALGSDLAGRLVGENPAPATLRGVRTRLESDLAKQRLIQWHDGKPLLAEKGAALLEQNISKLPAGGMMGESLLNRDESIRRGIAAQRDLIAKEEGREREHRAQLKASAQRREEQRKAAIPGKLNAIALDIGLVITDCGDEELFEAQFDERLVILWDAIVDADAAL